MNGRQSIRPAGPADADAIADLVRFAIPSNLHPVAIAAQPGYRRHLHAILQYMDMQPFRQLFVAEYRGQVVGFADFRIADEASGFLSYISVAPHSRGTGLGNSLLDAFFTNNPRIESLSLDVFEDNLSARRLYARRGFQETSKSLWLTRPLNYTLPVEAEISNAAEAEAQMRVYGFTQFSIVLPEGSKTIGRIGSSTVRAFTRYDFTDPTLDSLAKRIVPEADTLLFIGQVDAVDTSASVVMAQSVRMTLSIGRLSPKV